MHLLAYWRIDNYLRDLDEGAGFNYNSRQSRLHTEIELGESLWLFTVLKNPPMYFLAARLVVRAKTSNPPDYKYGEYRVWGDLQRSRYFNLRPDVETDEAFSVLRGLPLVSGSLGGCSRSTLPQACQTIRGIAPEGIAILEQFSAMIPTEDRATHVADEYELERALLEGDELYGELLNRDHTGASEDRRRQLLTLAPRDRQLVKDLYELYSGRCQLCAFDSPVVYRVASAESHHIVYRSRGGDDDLTNMVLVCPNHHTVIHKTDATFDYSRLMFCFPNGRVEPLCLNTHLSTGCGTSRNRPGLLDEALPSIPDMVSLMRVVVTLLTPDLLSPEWAALRGEGDHPLTGYCYVASEAIYYLAGGANAGISIYRCTLPEGGTHWWLVDSSGEIIDATVQQFSKPPEYAAGVRTHFLSKAPSKRAARLIAKVRVCLSAS
jgi:5-methylcytosine-specific restriction enzyme A